MMWMPDKSARGMTGGDVAPAKSVTPECLLLFVTPAFFDPGPQRKHVDSESQA